MLVVIASILVSALHASDDLKTYKYQGVYEEMGEYYQYVEDCGGLEASDVLSSFEKGEFRLYEGTSRAFNQGMTACNYWLVLRVQNDWERERRLLWSFFNNGIEVTYYELVEGQMVELTTASLHQSLLDRPFPSRAVSYPFYLEKGAERTFFVKVRPTVNGHVYFPTEMNDVEDYFIWEIDFTYLFGKFVGIFFFALFVNLFLFILLRDWVYINHFAYIAFVLLFQLSDFHIDAFQFSGALFEWWSYVNKGALVSMTIFFHSRVLRMFTGMDLTFPAISRALRYMNIILLTLSVLSLVVSFGFTDDATLAFQFSWILNWANNIGFGLLFCAILAGVLNGNRYSRMYGIASALMIYGFIAYLLNTFDILFLHIFAPGNIINGVVFEVALLTIFLIYKYKAEREADAAKIISEVRRNDELSRRMIDLQEAERQSIAKDVHDEVGNDIAALQLYIQNSFKTEDAKDKQSSYLLEKVGALHQKVRNVSHDLMTLPTDKYWIDSVKEVMSFYQINTKDVDFNFHTNIQDAVDLSINIKSHLLRIIKEITSNIVRHAGAKNAHIQLFAYEDKIILTIEDDGVGFDTSDSYDGIGLENIAFRIQYLGGALDLDSGANGTHYAIEIPIQVVAEV